MIRENVLPVRVIGLNITRTSQTLFGIFRLLIDEEPKMSDGNILDKFNDSKFFHIPFIT